MNKTSTNIPQMMNRFEELCRKKGLRITHQRTEIFRALATHAEHPTTEEIFNRVRKQLKTISLDTVYRTIATFEEYGLVQRVHHIDNATHFDTNISNHHHLVCTKCKRIEDFYWPDFDRMKPPKSIAHWGEVEEKQVVINALCSNCRKKK